MTESIANGKFSILRRGVPVAGLALVGTGILAFVGLTLLRRKREQAESRERRDAAE